MTRLQTQMKSEKLPLERDAGNLTRIIQIRQKELSSFSPDLTEKGGGEMSGTFLYQKYIVLFPIF